ncbi:hypothetical protein BZA05DRAFT_49514 [Tricharina praecox]|uniref:uncharacterized protein n=1 Tax=Tricharina praecox TaxID=43433 RepID=UPI00221F5AB6|nr:uncharacterized protein BZA05DRAFT_49514 [Tricharina praecox]KAI5852007.1 hypothetical protein BZA05DRAFT_49514 [Tricharina praecox]
MDHYQLSSSSEIAIESLPSLGLRRTYHERPCGELLYGPGVIFYHRATGGHYDHYDSRPASCDISNAQYPTPGTSPNTSGWHFDAYSPEAGADYSSISPLSYGYQSTDACYTPPQSPRPRKRGPFQCERCERTFSTSTNFTRHNSSSNCAIKGGLGKDGMSFPCTECGKAYNRNDNLKKHIKEKHPSLEKPLQG